METAYVHKAELSFDDSLCIGAVPSVFWYVIGDALIKRHTQRECLRIIKLPWAAHKIVRSGLDRDLVDRI